MIDALRCILEARQVDLRQQIQTTSIPELNIEQLEKEIAILEETVSVSGAPPSKQLDKLASLNKEIRDYSSLIDYLDNLCTIRVAKDSPPSLASLQKICSILDKVNPSLEIRKLASEAAVSMYSTILDDLCRQVTSI